ncbi:MAG: hypothetical protein M1833_004358 [Piccolia ochrophora]|nr:MAG: hypothetical protein M1833_004358 [Piccolia ochrophora]
MSQPRKGGTKLTMTDGAPERRSNNNRKNNNINEFPPRCSQPEYSTGIYGHGNAAYHWADIARASVFIHWGNCALTPVPLRPSTKKRSLSRRRTPTQAFRRFKGRPGNGSFVRWRFAVHGAEPNPSHASPNSSATQVPLGIPVELDGEMVYFDPTFLRDSCQCPLCVDPSTKQKVFSTTSLNPKLAVRSEARLDNGDLRLTWEGDMLGYPEDHVTVLSETFLRARATYRTRLENMRKYEHRRVLWERAIMKSDVQFLPYEEYMNDDAVLYEVLRQLDTHGLIFLNGVPPAEESVERIGLRIGSLMDTFYGRTWDVSYTNQDLTLHQDLLYFADPPHLQLLHCIHNTVAGGTSLFSDGFRVASALGSERQQPPAKILSEYPVTFHYHNAGEHYSYIRPVIELEPRRMSPMPHLAPRPKAINWAPPFQAPMQVLTRTKQFHAWLNQAQKFNYVAGKEDSLFSRRMEEGECVLFDNRRVLHGRRAFEVKEGKRWLRGAYIGGDAYRSRLRVLKDRYGAQEGL